jgi:hypothetical protein
MTRISVLIGILMLTGLLAGQNTENNDLPVPSDPPAVSAQNQLILWISGDREVALKMVFMYTYYCRKNAWMDTVRLLIWGPSSKLISEDTELQGKLNDLKEIGVELYACKACADLYGVSDKLEQLGVTVEYTGTMLADLQKQGWHVLSL